MKNIYLLLICLSFSTLSYGQFWSDFEDGTLQGFTNGDGTTEQLFVYQEAGSHFLQKDCDGSNSAVGEMMIINTEQWIGNYFYSPTGDDMAMRGIDEIYIRNENDFDIHLRVGFTGSNGYQVVSTLPTIIPAFSDWNFYNLPYYVDFPTISNLTIINNVDGIPFLELFNHIHDLFEDVVEIRFFHNEEVLFNPQTVTGSLQINDIYSYQLLNNTDNSLSKVRLYPNPVSSNLMVQIPNALQAEVKVYNVLGDKVKSQTLDYVRTSLDLSALQSGIYLVKISLETETITKKIIKD